MRTVLVSLLIQRIEECAEYLLYFCTTSEACFYFISSDICNTYQEEELFLIQETNLCARGNVRKIISKSSVLQQEMMSFYGMHSGLYIHVREWNNSCQFVEISQP